MGSGFEQRLLDFELMAMRCLLFQPTDMIEKIRTFKHQEAEVEIKVRQLSHLKLDASSIEAIKQLKGGEKLTPSLLLILWVAQCCCVLF